MLRCEEFNNKSADGLTKAVGVSFMHQGFRLIDSRKSPPSS